MRINTFRILLFIVAVVFSFTFSSCNNNIKPSSREAVIEYTDTTYDFGILHKDGEKATHVFVFTNKGISPLIVQKVLTSCQCSEADFTRKPIPSGKKGKVKVTINQQQLPVGSFTRSIVVYSNAYNSRTMLVVKGRVE